MSKEDINQMLDKARAYYANFDPSEVTENQYFQWLQTLPANIEHDFIQKGFHHALTAIPFQAWYLKNVKGLEPDF